MEDKVYFSITEVSQREKIPPYTLRYWEKCGLIKPDRSKKRRKYSMEEFKKIKKINKLLKLGYSIKGIKKSIKKKVENTKIDLIVINELKEIKKELEKLLKSL